MDEEGFFAVGFFDVFAGDAGLEVQDVVGVGTEGAEDAVDFGVLGDLISIPVWVLMGASVELTLSNSLDSLSRSARTSASSSSCSCRSLSRSFSGSAMLMWIVSGFNVGWFCYQS